MSEKKPKDCWSGYLDHFDYFANAKIRNNNHPRALVHKHQVENSIVLVHGLSDSPYYMKALAEFFHTELGYNVYLPLLQGHGLQDPQGMDSVTLEEWKLNVSYAISKAKTTQTRVSVGGFSTGGALSYLMAVENPDVTGALYLFSAALDLSDEKIILSGNLKESVLRSERFVNLSQRALGLMSRASSLFNQGEDSGPNLIGENPFKYKFIDLDGAHQLARLIEQTDRITAGFSSDKRFKVPVFIAHSEVDETVDIKALKELEKLCERPDSLYFAADLEIKHAELVLDEDITPTDPGKEQNRNPEFKNMTHRIARFAHGQTAIV